MLDGIRLYTPAGPCFERQVRLLGGEFDMSHPLKTSGPTRPGQIILYLLLSSCQRCVVTNQMSACVLQHSSFKLKD